MLDLLSPLLLAPPFVLVEGAAPAAPAAVCGSFTLADEVLGAAALADEVLGTFTLAECC